MLVSALRKSKLIDVIFVDFLAFVYFDFQELILPSAKFCFLCCGFCIATARASRVALPWQKNRAPKCAKCRFLQG